MWGGLYAPFPLQKDTPFGHFLFPNVSVHENITNLIGPSRFLVVFPEPEHKKSPGLHETRTN